MKNTPKALTRAGAMTAGSVSVHSSSIISMKSGMMPSWVGTIMVATTTSSRNACAARNRSLAKANPASVEKSTTEAVTADATISELSRAMPNGTVSKTRRMFSTRFAPGEIGGGTRRAPNCPGTRRPAEVEREAPRRTGRPAG